MWAAEGKGGLAQLVNISTTGARMQVGQPLKFGSRLALICSRIPGLPGRAVVKWCRPADGAIFHCGIAFDDSAVDPSRWNEQVVSAL